jgi:hypothetical protein
MSTILATALNKKNEPRGGGCMETHLAWQGRVTLEGGVSLARLLFAWCSPLQLLGAGKATVSRLRALGNIQEHKERASSLLLRG